MSEHQPRDPQETPEAQLAAAANGVSKTRRNLLRAGAIGAPALIALKPASVIACDCKLPSGFTVSGNLSRGPKNCAAPGRKASAWRTNKPSPYGACKDLTVSSLTFNLVAPYTGTTVDSWLAKGDTSEQGLVMACYLEAMASGNDLNWPKKDKFVAMWNQGIVGSGYTPKNQTVAWTKAKVISYLMFLTGQAPA